VSELLRPNIRVLVAFAAIYILWGSTYLAIRYAVEDIPPFLMAASRFLVAGTVLYVWERARGAAAPTPAQWRTAALIGALFFLCGNGLLSWAELRVPSGEASLLVATMPLWLAVLEAVTGSAPAPGLRVTAGIVLGLGGVAVLVGAPVPGAGRGIDLLGAGALVAAAALWAVGALPAVRRGAPSTPVLGAGMQMLAGGTLLAVVGIATGEAARFAFSTVTLRSVLSVGYLVVFGSLLGFTAFTWLLHTVSPSRVATYAFVNPVVAVLVGGILGGESLGPRVLVASALVVAAVALIVSAKPGSSVSALETSGRAPD
jgi:drug/metabolite transporter (DMT)-like permease